MRGIVFQDATGQIMRTPERVKIPDLDALPLPDRAAIDSASTSTCGAAITAPAASI